MVHILIVVSDEQETSLPEYTGWNKMNEIIALGDQIVDVFIGDKTVIEIYLGNDLIWSNGGTEQL